MTTDNDATYRMTLSLNLLRHLGFGLYSNVPAVLSEAVANAWDADATRVDIVIDSRSSVITITDDGHGMSVDDANNRYLHVGYERRQNPETAMSRSGRVVMGRKGIGKLSLFSIANSVKVETASEGNPHGFTMDRFEIEEQLTLDPNARYYPPPISRNEVSINRGTKITLTDLKRRTNSTARYLRRRLARRFSVIDSEDTFVITLNGVSVTPSDREYYSKIQYLWTFGEAGERAAVFSPHAEHVESRPRNLVGGDSTMAIQGWIATALAAGDLKDSETSESINNIVILVRGKLAQEAILNEFGEAGIYSSYVFGEIHADFLDQDDEEDIATTSRQRIIEDDPRYEALKDKLQSELRIVKNRWTYLRNREGATQARTNPYIDEWFLTLSEDHQVAAERLFGRIHQLPIDEEDDKRQLFVSGIMAFENLKLRNLLNRLDQLSVDNLDALAETFAQLDDLEATAYYQITRDRMLMIDKLEEIVDADEKERVIQDHLYDHLWLLDPSWERATNNARMETTVNNALDAVVQSLSDDEKRRRLDIYYAHYAGKHVIIELKRYSRRLRFDEIHSQCRRYRNATRNALQGMNRGNETIELIFLIGRNVRDWVGNTEIENEDRLRLNTYNTTVVSYDRLIENAQRAYREYTNRHLELGRIYQLIQRMSDEDVESLHPVG